MESGIRKKHSVIPIIALLMLQAFSTVAEAQREVIFEMDDPAGDDHGPGNYVYPENDNNPYAEWPDVDMFPENHLDLRHFRVVKEEYDVVFEFELGNRGPNPWWAPNGFSFQIIEVYIDKDRIPGSGRTDDLGGPNIRIHRSCAWEIALRIGGWNDERNLIVGAEAEPIIGAMTIFPEANSIIARVPIDLIGEPSSAWAYVVVLGSQDGYGENFWRYFAEKPEAWKCGGTADPTAPRPFDILVPPGQSQEDLLRLRSPLLGVSAAVPGVGIGILPLVAGIVVVIAVLIVMLWKFGIGPFGG